MTPPSTFVITVIGNQASGETGTYKIGFVVKDEAGYRRIESVFNEWEERAFLSNEIDDFVNIVCRDTALSKHLLRIVYLKDEKEHNSRRGNPAVQRFSNGKRIAALYKEEGVLHNPAPDVPAVQIFDEEGNLTRTENWNRGVLVEGVSVEAPLQKIREPEEALVERQMALLKNKGPRKIKIILNP